MTQDERLARCVALLRAAIELAEQVADKDRRQAATYLSIAVGDVKAELRRLDARR